ncbi:hypothetical protein ACFY0G_02090 [Streptomyces sp. NPDC001552]|uniref:hypothetical protein n=1 Tax=Streptomyces sp. NPDC001552 TaxID=3364587 RepID=UPI00368F260D
MNLATTATGRNMGTAESGRRFVASGIIRRLADRQEVAIVSEGGDIDRSGPLAVKGDTRRQVAERIAATGGAR